jgi:uncharacterized protein YecT (DUF1311 family)
MMKKILFLLVLTIAVCVSGCGKEDVDAPQEPQNTEAEKENTTEENKEQEDTEIDQDTESNQETEAENDTDVENDNEAVQNVPSREEIKDSLNAYITSIKEQADAINASLENDILNQQEMNMKAEELYKLWDGALNHVWGVLKDNLSEDEFAQLLDGQRIWIDAKEKAVEEAGKEVEGGSMYPLVVNSEAARLTEERVYELYDVIGQ